MKNSSPDDIEEPEARSPGRQIQGVSGLPLLSRQKKFIKRVLDEDNVTPIEELRRVCALTRIDVETMYQSREVREFVEAHLASKLVITGLPKILSMAIEQSVTKKSKWWAKYVKDVYAMLENKGISKNQNMMQMGDVSQFAKILANEQDRVNVKYGTKPEPEKIEVQEEEPE